MERVPQGTASADRAAILPAPDAVLLKHFDEKLLAYLAASPHPSLSLNRLQAALARGLDSQRQLSKLLGRAPRIAVVLEQILNETFGHDPHRLLFTPPPGGNRQGLRTLVQVALSLLRNPFLALETGVELSLSDRADSPLAWTPAQVLQRLKRLGLASRITMALDDYWQLPADGSHLSRRDRLVELHRLLFHDKVLLAHGLGVLSSAASGMLMGLLEAPTAEARARAGGRWAQLVVSGLVWPGLGQVAPVVSGALHVWRADNDMRGRQVVFVPGFAEEFFEFANLAELQRELPRHLNAPGNYRLWQLLPLQERHHLFGQTDTAALAYGFQACASLPDDALAHSALGRLDTQLANEWAGALLLNAAYMLPERLTDAERLTPSQAVEAMQAGRSALTYLPALKPLLARWLRRDEQYRMLEITFGSLAADIPQRMRQSKVRRQERGLLKLLEQQTTQVGASQQSVLLDDHEPWLKQAALVREMLQGRDDYSRADFWSTQDEQGVELAERLFKVRCQALLYEARMQRQLGLIEQPELERLLEVLPALSSVAPRRAPDTRIASLCVGPEASSWTLTGACVITTRQALADRTLNTPALLFVPGRLGGLEAFSNLESLSQQVGFTLLAAEGETLWPLVARDQRAALRDWLRQLPAEGRVAVHYRPVTADALREGVQQQIQQHLRICRAIEGGLRPFSEIADARGSLQMLAHELEQSLVVPGHDAREQALDNLAALQFATAQARELPAWLSDAALAVRRQYARLLARHQQSLQALERRLERQLPDLDDFARGKIIERLKQDGLYPGLDVDSPLFDLPDSVERVWSPHPEQPVGGSGPKTVVSERHRTYSFLQLALENLDPQLPGTRRRLEYGRILDSTWESRLTPDYLISTIFALDLGGQYDTLIQRAFYGVDDPRREALPLLERALLYRLVRQRARLELFSARQQGLGEQAAQLFEQALGGESVTPSPGERLAIELYFVTFAGRAFARARHVGNAVAIHDKVSGLTLLYLPGAPHAQVLTQYPDLQAAQRALVDRELASQRVTDIVQRLAAGWAEEVIEEYPAELSSAQDCPQSGPVAAAVSSSMSPLLAVSSGWLFKVVRSWWTSEPEQAVPSPQALEKEVRREIAQNPEQWLHLEKTTRTDLSLILAHAFVLRAQLRARAVSNSARQLSQQREVLAREQRTTFWLRVLSVMPVASIGVNVHETAVALRQFHRSGDLRDAFELFKAAHMTLADIALTLYPAGWAARPARVASGAGARAVLRSISRRRTLYHKGAAALKKRDPPTRPEPLLQGYATTLSDDDAVALRGPINAGSQVKNGVQFISDGRQHYEVYRPKGESALRLKKTAEQENELILHIREPGEHLLRADAPEPQPGPSRAAYHRPWVQAAEPAPTVAPVSRLAWMSRRPATARTHWKAWGLALEDSDVIELSADKGLYRYRDSDVRLLKLDGHYFELLAEGSDIDPEIVFIRRPGALAELALSDFEHWWSHLDQQPLPATFDPQTRLWTPRESLFDVPAERSLATIAPGMTADSRTLTLNRLVERADTAGTATTASRMVALRRTLETWETRGLDLHVLFRELDERPIRNPFRIGAPGSAGFSRLDFDPGHVINPRFFDIEGRHRIQDLSLHTERAVKDILRRHGFVVTEIPKARSYLSVNLDCVHPGSEHHYFIHLKWTKGNSVVLFSSPRSPLQLTDSWLRRLVDTRSTSHSALLQPARVALEEGRLVKLVAGLQRVPGSQRIVVFFIRVA